MNLKQLNRSLLLPSYAAVCLALASLPAGAQPVKRSPHPELFETHLGPTPVPDGAPTPIAGEGVVRASLDGLSLRINGQFSMKEATATAVHLVQGAGIGIPGSARMDVDLLPESRGELNATVKLSRDQLAALHSGRLYLVIDSTKSPAPTGHLWGWLLPVQEKLAQDEPHLGNWELPQGAGLKASQLRPSSR